MNNIYILSGKVHSGKSKQLLEWSNKLSSAAGVVSPVTTGKKHIRNISSGEERILQVDSPIANKKIITVGNYFFIEETFAWARGILLQSNRSCPQWIIIDEIGYLELNGSGLEPAISQILPEIKHNVLIVIREKLIEKTIARFQLDKYGTIMISEKLPDAE